MAQGMDPNEQRLLEFAEAESEARNRLIQLGRALRDLGASSDLCLLARLIYDNTSDGVGAAWQPTGGEELFLGHAWGCRCKRSTFYGVKRSRGYKLLICEENGSYRINWANVYAVRGLPLPHTLACQSSGARESAARSRATLAASGLSLEREDRAVAANGFLGSPIPGLDSPGTGLVCPEIGLGSPGIGLPSHSGGACHSAPNACAPAGAPAHLSSCLVVLMSVDVDDKTRDRMEAKAMQIRASIFAHRPCARCDDETRRFVATVAVIAIAVGGPWAECIDFATAATKCRKADKPGPYLRNTLRNSLVEFAGLFDTEVDAKVGLGRLLSQARRIAVCLTAYQAEPELEPEPPAAHKAPVDRTPIGADCIAAMRAKHADTCR